MAAPAPSPTGRGLCTCCPALGLHRPSGVQRHLPGEAVPPSRQACWSQKSRSRGCCPPPAACCPRLLRGADPGAPAGSRPPPRGCTYLAVVGACVPEPPAQAANAVQHQAPDQVVLQGPVGGRGGRAGTGECCLLSKQGGPGGGENLQDGPHPRTPVQWVQCVCLRPREVPLRKGSRGR